jgi:hypothetical protein
MAELVDALVSNTCVCKDMPVRLRLWVLCQQEYAATARELKTKVY